MRLVGKQLVRYDAIKWNNSILKKMQQEINNRDRTQFNGINRMVVTFDWKYWGISEGNWKMP